MVVTAPLGLQNNTFASLLKLASGICTLFKNCSKGWGEDLLPCLLELTFIKYNFSVPLSYGLHHGVLSKATGTDFLVYLGHPKNLTALMTLREIIININWLKTL